MINVSIKDRHADDAMRDRVEQAVLQFQAETGLSDEQTLAAYSDPTHRYFDKLDSAMMRAAIEGFADQTYVVGEIVLS
jgi:hypothetical protein